MARLLCLLIGLLGFSACMRSNGLHYEIGEHGMKRVTPESVASALDTRCVAAVETVVGTAWQAEIQLSDLPYYLYDEHSYNSWWFDRLTVSLRLIGDGSEDPASIDTGALRRVLENEAEPYMAINNHLQIEIAVVNDAATFTALQQAESEALAAAVVAEEAAQAVDEERQAQHGTSGYYIVQDGDTLALIATVFYGDARHWRLIAAANPEVRIDALDRGTRLIIPPAPAADR